MKTYEIKLWDANISETDDVYPVVYFKPDRQLIEDIQLFGGLVTAKISGTGTVYDTVPSTQGELIPSNEIAVTTNSALRFLSETNEILYGLSLPSIEWNGCPSGTTQGIVEILTTQKDLSNTVINVSNAHPVADEDILYDPVMAPSAPYIMQGYNIGSCVRKILYAIIIIIFVFWSSVFILRK